MAMDDGKIIAHGTLKELLEKTGEPTLDEAFIALLPEEKRALHQRWWCDRAPLRWTSCRRSRPRA